MPYERLVRVATSPTAEKPVKDQAFAELVRRFEPMVMAHASRTLGDPHKAEDAAQNAFIEMYGKLHQLQNPVAFPSWLRRIVQTQCHRQLRKQRHQFVPVEEVPDLVSGSPDPLAEVEARQRSDRLQRAIDRLPETERIATRMFYYDQLSHAEIAERLRIPAKTIKSRLHSARGRLRTALEHRSPTLDRLAVARRPQLSLTRASAAPRVVALPARTRDTVSMAA